MAPSVSSVATQRESRITLSLTRSTLRHAIDEIARQAGMRVVTNRSEAPLEAIVSVRVTNVTVEDALAAATRGTTALARITPDRETILLGGRSTIGTASHVASGSIRGRVVDAKTNQPLRGATVRVDDATSAAARRGVQTDAEGQYRLADVDAGARRITVRLLGYTPSSRTVQVPDGQAVVIDVSLTPSVNALDQVVVTGTIVATAQREVPSAMTVITGKELQARGITHIEQLFRGDVPGLFAVNQGSNNGMDAVLMFSRGATAVTASSLGTSSSTNPIKTYVDGIELADSKYLSQIDPTSIERIEILTGPQASTIYGSNAINGVMQIFTKRGTNGRRPQLTLTLQSGWVENNYRPSRTPQHDDQLQVQGTEGHWSYNTGGSWNYLGPWTPAKQTSRLSGFGGARVQQGPITVDGSLRLATTRNAARGQASQGNSSGVEDGWFQSLFTTRGASAPQTQTLTGQTLGLTLSYAPVAWWFHELVLGQDQSNTTILVTAQQLSGPTDTLLYISQGNVSRTSWRYATTAQAHLTSLAKVVVTVGGDGWTGLNRSVSVYPSSLTGTLTGTTTVNRTPSHNAGGFVQAQVGVAEQLFLTYGLRAEWNSGFGSDIEPNLAPRYGVSYTRDLRTSFGTLTTKLRASYGRSTRPPDPTFKQDQHYSDVGRLSMLGSYYGDALYRAGNVDLGPEFQQGGEGGVELYFGNRGSLVVTRYNQTIDGLIASANIDSSKSVVTGLPPSTIYRTSVDADGYGYYPIQESLNIGSIRNQGWEGQGTVNLGPFTTRGTYSWTKSRVIGVTPKYRGMLASTVQIQPGATFLFLPEHTWAFGVRYTRAATSMEVNVTGVGQLRSSGNALYFERVNSLVRLTENRYTITNPVWNQMNRGYTLADVNLTHRISSAVEGLLQVQNLADRYQNDLTASNAVIGRQSKVGFRVRY